MLNCQPDLGLCKQSLSTMYLHLHRDLSHTAIEYLPTDGLKELDVLKIEATFSMKVFPSIYNFQVIIPFDNLIVNIHMSSFDGWFLLKYLFKIYFIHPLENSQPLRQYLRLLWDKLY